MPLKHSIFRHPLEWRVGDKVGLKSIHKYVYPYVTRRFGANGVLFINYGYEEDPPMAVPLESADEKNRFGVQLYHSAATQVDITGGRVLEIGCGHGGGACYLVRTFQPTSYIGLDLNEAGIEFCRSRYALPGLDFVHGDAERLPFQGESFDVVMNIESSIHYPNFSRFLDEVNRVLTPGGHFLYSDGRMAGDIADWETALADSPLQLVTSREINAEVVRALERNGSRPTQQGVYRHVPAILRDATRIWNRWVFRALRSGRISYRMYHFTKV